MEAGPRRNLHALLQLLGRLLALHELLVPLQVLVEQYLEIHRVAAWSTQGFSLEHTELQPGAPGVAAWST